MMRTTPNLSFTTATQCLAAIAQHYGATLSSEKLTRDYAIGRYESGVDLLIKMATANGLDAYYRSVDCKTLLSLEGVFPVIAKLDNGNYVIIAGIKKENGRLQVAVVDPLEKSQNVLLLDAAPFCTRWKGDAVFIKRPLKPSETPVMSQQELNSLTNEVNLLLAWRQTGYASPPPDFIKKEALLRHLSKFDPKETIFIETGTATGSTAKMVAERGYRVITIELSDQLYAYSKTILEPLGVTCLHGNSAIRLPEVIESLPRGLSVFLWLDGHYSGSGTAQGDSDTPIVQELLAVEKLLARSEKPLMVQVDDIRLFGTDENYPELNHLVDYCRKNMLYWNIVLDSFLFSNRKKLLR